MIAPKQEILENSEIPRKVRVRGGHLGLRGPEHYSFSRSKYFHLLITPIEGFIA